jgi:DNA-binding CsgD family transcriptional regulator
VLVGRERECARIDALLEAARSGESRCLVVRGEAGIGKTALLDHAIARADGMTVLRTLGIESDAELEFSGLLDVCRPVLACLKEIPERHADVLRAALGLGAAADLDRFSVGAATLSLLAAAAESNPLLLVVDDAHWLDRSSQDTLLFATRRLEADRAAVLYATRDGAEPAFVPSGLESITLQGLDGDDALALLHERALAALAPDVARRIIEASAGNPLALLELPQLLSPEQLTGDAPLGDPLTPGSGIEQAFVPRIEALPEHTRQALLIAAVSSSGDLGPIISALRSAGLAGAALEPGEDAGLIDIAGDRIAFRHPLVRSVVYHLAAPSQRRRAHRAVAEALDGGASAEQRAWHLAAAAVGPDEEVASALSRAAADVKRRAGLAAAASALERAAQLTPDAGDRRARLADAAEAAWHAGRRESALALGDASLDGCEQPELRSRMLHLRGLIFQVAGDAQEASRILVEAAALIEATSPSRAAATLADAVEALTDAGERSRALEAARRARALVPHDGSDADFLAASAMGQALTINGLAIDAAPHLERALELVERDGLLWNTPRRLVVAARTAGRLERLDDGVALGRRAAALYRDAGDAGLLPAALEATARLLARAGRWAEAYADASEAIVLAQESGQTTTILNASRTLAHIDAYRGDEAACRSHIEGTEELAIQGLLALGLGRLDEVVATLAPAAPQASVVADLIEAYVRLGRHDDAAAAFERLSSFALPDGPRSVAALLARCRGLLAPEAELDSAFEEALALAADLPDAVGLARTRLLVGERLRRAGRRVEARAQLRRALETFEQLGAEPWAERTRQELRASGQRLQRRRYDEPAELTPQELQIARQVAEAKSNKEVGAALFLSPKTVEYHLQRIYRKLDMRSRAELIRWMASEG